MSPEIIERPAPKKSSPLFSPVNTHRPFRKRRSVRIALWTLGIALTGFILAGIIIPRIAAYQAQKITGRSFRFGFLVISPNGHVSISARGGQQLNQTFHLNAARVRLDWWAIILKRLRVGYLDLKDANFDIEQTAAGELIVNGINTAQMPKSAQQPQPDSPAQSIPSGKPWGLGIGGVTMKNLHFKFKTPELNSELVINQLLIGKAESWHPQYPTPIEADLTLNGARILLNGTVMPFSPTPHVDLEFDFVDFPLESIAGLLGKSGIHEAAGLLSIQGKFKSERDRESGALDGKGSFDIGLKKVTALYKQPADSPEGREQKFRLGADGIFHLEDLVLHRTGTTTETSSVLTYSLAQLKNTGPFSVDLKDESFKRPPQFRLDPLTFDIKDISSIDPDKALSFDVKANLGRYDRLELAGNLTPFAKVWNGKLAINIKELNLTPFTAYSERATGSRIQTGVLNLDARATIKNDMLEAQDLFHIKNLNFQYINKEKEEEQTGKVGIPLNVMLSLLKDKNGDIKLEVPVEGPARDPNVGFGPLMGKLTAKALSIAAQKAATAFFPPLKTIQLAGSIFTFATKWRFEPLVFVPGTLQLTPESEAYLTEVGKKMQEKPQVRLNVCGFGTRMDLPGSSKVKPDEELPPLTDKERDVLIKLSTDRAAFIKDLFVTKYAIDSGRLLICSPDVEEKNTSLPRTTLAL